MIENFKGKRGRRGKSRERKVLEPLVEAIFGLRWDSYQKKCWRNGGKATEVGAFLEMYERKRLGKEVKEVGNRENEEKYR